MAPGYLPKPKVGPGGMKPLAPPRGPGPNSPPQMGNYNPNNLGVGILSAPQVTVAGAPKLPGTPGVPRQRRKVMGKMKATLRPKTKVANAQTLARVPGPNLNGI